MNFVLLFNLLGVCEEYTNANNITEARELLRIVDKMFEDYEWRSINETLLEKLFQMFFSSIGPGAEDEDNLLIIQKGLEVCLRHVLESLHNHDLMIAVSRSESKFVFNEMCEGRTKIHCVSYHNSFIRSGNQM